MKQVGGAACCSGDGDFILKFCPAFHVVQLLKQVGGAACCIGDGDFILKFCPAFHVVQLLNFDR